MTDPVSIVTYRPDHAVAWRSLNEAWLAHGGYSLETKDRAVLGDPDGTVLGRGGAIFMAERNGKAVGCCSVMRMADGGYEVGKMAVTPSAVGLGIGWALLEACEAVAVKSGASRLYLETNAAQTHAIALYGRFGFVRMSAQPTPYARCNVWMEKPLLEQDHSLDRS